MAHQFDAEVDPQSAPQTQQRSSGRSEYQVIARRYRPRRFDEVVGQEAAAATLRNAILQDRLAHAYLFCGPRGVGKTSMARIFARALNCPAASDRDRPQEEWGVPCGECQTCAGVHTGDDIDVTEMDGASNRGIEDVREIIESVKFRPTRSRYKIYIVDEVHMLTREAFNAFLKVLEEPPAHVKFIFATTEPHKIPDTVLSRCQRFDFQSIRDDDIVRRLLQICEGENVQSEEGLLEEIARISRGGLRDSQTLLDQLISFSNEELRVDDLHRITGRLSDASLDGLSEAVLGQRPADVLTFLEETFRAGTDPAVLLEQFVERLRGALADVIRENAPAERIDRLLACLQVLHETATRLKGSPYPQLAIEIALVRLARLEEPQTLEEVLGWLKKLEGQLQGVTPALPSGGDRLSPSGGEPRRTVSGGTAAPVSPSPVSETVVSAASTAATPPTPTVTLPEANPEANPEAMPESVLGTARSQPDSRMEAEPRRESAAPIGQSGEQSGGQDGRSWKASLQERARSRSLEAPSVTATTPPVVSEAPAVSVEVPPAVTVEAASESVVASPPELNMEDSRPVSTPVVAPAIPVASEPAVEAPVAGFAHVLSLWDQIFVEFRERHPQLQPYLRDAAIGEGGDGEILLQLSSDFHHKQLSDRGRLEKLEELVTEITGQTWQVRPVLQKKQANASGNGHNDQQTGPALKDDPLVQKSLKLFRGRIV